jgi:GMP synthase-like glutamine amidotransferase
VLVMEHAGTEMPGVIGERAAELGFQVVRFAVEKQAPFPDPRDFATVVVLGSVESVFDTRVPWIRPEADLVAAAVAGSVPVLGICFGGQLLAQVLGGQVARARRPESAWLTVDTDDPALVPPGPWLVWHQDAFTVPPGAREIARNEVCAQAFTHGPHLGLQFHPEVTPEIIESWLSDAEARGSGLDPHTRAIREATDRHTPASAANARRLFDTFLARAEVPAFSDLGVDSLGP